MITLSVSIWAVLAMFVLALAIYRKVLSSKEDDSMHLADADTGIVSQQNVLAEKLEIIDKWGEMRRFIVGKSTGFIPIHLEIKTRRSRDGPGVMGTPFRSVRPPRLPRR